VKVLGLDEAGRGPVIGSMFIGGYMLEEDKEDFLTDLDVKDSKKLSDKKRDRIEEELEEKGEKFLKEITASEIDQLREVMTLNEIETQAFADVIERAEPDKVILDLPEPNAERYIKKVKAELPAKLQDIEIIAEHGADDTYPIVSAASIVAKTEREKHVERLHEKYGYDFGSGYPHDPPVKEFLREYFQENSELPSDTRMSWSSAEKIIEEESQSGLSEF
jgi:ribonuclease HII